MKTTTDVVIEAEGLSRVFGGKAAVDSVTLAVPRGAVFAFLGRNGSGKTTLIRMLLGLLEPTAGQSRLFGESSLAIRDDTRGRIGYVSESHTIYEWMTAAEAGYYQSRFFARWSNRVFADVIARFGVPLETKGRSLSRGQRAGLSLALALAAEPDLIILDDPAIGLDPVARQVLLDLVLEVTSDPRRTVFFSSHQLDDVERVATHVAILDRGILRADCAADELALGVRRFILAFSGTPPEVPAIPGLLGMNVFDSRWMHLTVEQPTVAARRLIDSLGAASVEERAVGFGEAVRGHLNGPLVPASFRPAPAQIVEAA
jgi:ABC-2 type transport system ATP-binding protein